MTAQNRSRAGFACSVALLFLGSVGCASTSTRSDRATVRDVVAKHGGLQFDARDPGSEPRHTATQETRRLLARPLSADDAVRIAFLENRDLRAQLADLGVARADLVRLTTLPNPEGHAAVRMSRDPNQDPQWDFGVAMNLTRLILVGKADSVGTNRLEAARMRTAGAALTLAYRVRLAYYALQAAQGKLALLRANVDAARASVETATELHRVGNLPALDLSQQEAAFAERAWNFRRRKPAWSAHEMLGILLGVPNGDDLDRRSEPVGPGRQRAFT
ncbi:MAG: TolC family protein [Polyangiales bacterium]